MTTLDPTTRDTVIRIVDRLKDTPGALLPVLHAVQDALGYIPPESVPIVADRMNVSRAEVHGVISFYHYFRQTRPGRHTVYVCRAESCQSMNSKALEHHARRQLGVDFHETTSDGEFSLEPVYCLGNCALSPAMMVDGHVYGRVTPQRFDSVVSNWRKR